MGVQRLLLSYNEMVSEFGEFYNPCAEQFEAFVLGKARDQKFWALTYTTKERCRRAFQKFEDDLIDGELNEKNEKSNYGVEEMCQWLARLPIENVQQCVDVFRKHQVDGKTMSLLTIDALRDMGVDAVVD